MQKCDFKNYGFLKDKLPDSLFKDLLEESNKNLERYDVGIKGGGLPGHYKLSNPSLHAKVNRYILTLAAAYNQIYPNYLNSISIANKALPFGVGDCWFNFQNKTDYFPNHMHNGVYSFSIWLKIPFFAKDESTGDEDGYTSKFQFVYSSILGDLLTESMDIDKSNEGEIVLFPSKMMHCVFPFYSSNETRISFSGNVQLISQ